MRADCVTSLLRTLQGLLTWHKREAQSLILAIEALKHSPLVTPWPQFLLFSSSLCPSHAGLPLLLESPSRTCFWFFAQLARPCLQVFAQMLPLLQGLLVKPFAIALVATQNFLFEFIHSLYHALSYYTCYLKKNLSPTWVLSVLVHCWIHNNGSSSQNNTGHIVAQ